MSDQFKTLQELEKEHILKALDLYEGNKTQAAQALGITIKTLYNKLHEYELFEKYSVRPKINKNSWDEVVQSSVRPDQLGEE